MLDPKILDRARRLIQTKFDARRELFPREISRIKGELSAHNMLRSSITLNKIHAICAEEVAIRTQIVWDGVVRAHNAFGSPPTETLAGDIKEEVNHFIGTIIEEVSQKMAEEMHFMERDASHYNLQGARDSAIKKIDIEADIYVDSLTSGSEGKTFANSGSKTIFISHANEDAVLAEAVKTQIDNVFGKKVSVFVSSIPGTIPPGSDWFNRIVSNLTENNAFIVLVTPSSEKRPFVWFEIGFSWLRMLNRKCEIYAICVPPINPGDLPEPLCRLQAISLADEKQIRAFFNKLISQFELGNISVLECAKICVAPSLNPKLNAEAQTMLLEAAQDEDGCVLRNESFDGISIETNKKNLIPEQNPRTIAKWEESLRELCTEGLLEEFGDDGNIFKVTNKGYQFTDFLNTQGK